ncbi:predicted protein [Streptomyces albidoflavus]|nr:predicted protein [Streptomyces albidoflavus]
MPVQGAGPRPAVRQRARPPRGRNPPLHEGCPLTVNGVSTALIVLGLFFLGGVYSFYKQKLPTGILVVLGIGAAMSLTAGVLRLDVWG